MTEGSYLQSRFGTELYLAPEVKDMFPPEMEGTSATFNFSEKIDIWSLGILTFYLVYHEHPFTFKKQRELRKYIEGGPFHFLLLLRSKSVRTASASSRRPWRELHQRDHLHMMLSTATG